MGDDDQHVIGRVLGGDTEAFRLLVERHGGQLLAFIRDLVPRSGEWEDVAQEVFLAAYVHLGSYDPRRAAFATWLLTIARHKCLNVLKRHRPLVPGELPEQADPRTPDAAAADAELYRRLDDALAGLPVEQRTAFVLAEIQGLSLEEVARVEGVPLGTVKSRLCRAREKLRRSFERRAEALG